MTRTTFAGLALFLLAPAHAATAPKPARLETYKDWTVGCDNGGACTAVSLMPEGKGVGDNFVGVAIMRNAGPNAQPSVRLDFHDSVKGNVRVSVDGRPVATVLADGESALLRGPRASALVIGIAVGSSLEIAREGKIIARPSLAGSSAALRYMDGRQGRAGTITALVAAGSLQANAVKPAPALPRLTRAAVPLNAKLSPLTAAERRQAEKLTGCDPQFDHDRSADLYPLGGGRTLVMLPCGSGAYNFANAALIATGATGNRQFVAANFDFQPEWGEGGFPTLVNHGWEPAKAMLTSYAKGRGLGDCGSSESYIWDGSRFRLAEASSMGECRGAMQWITTWRTVVTGP